MRLTKPLVFHYNLFLVWDRLGITFNFIMWYHTIIRKARPCNQTQYPKTPARNSSSHIITVPAVQRQRYLSSSTFVKLYFRPSFSVHAPLSECLRSPCSASASHYHFFPDSNLISHFPFSFLRPCPISSCSCLRFLLH
jgi:hypothetical protein